MELEKNIKIMKTSKGKDQLVIDGFVLYCNKQVEEIRYWDCRYRSHASGEQIKRKCRGRATTTGFGATFRVLAHEQENHCHEPDSLYVEKVALSNELKRCAQEDGSNPAKIIRKVGSDFAAEVQGMISVAAQRKLVHRTKATSSRIEPRTLEEFDVPEEFKLTLDGNKFYQGMLQVGDDSAIMFAANEDLRKLSTSKYWIADGTFDTVPALYKQLFSIHGSISPDHQKSFPSVYVLMTSKKEELYREVLSHLTEVADELDIALEPKLILTDFEKAMINAFQSEFPDAKQSGCFFHLSQNLWKAVQANQLTTKFGENIEIYETFKQLQALAFVPPKDVPSGFKLIEETSPDAFKPIENYFGKTYVHGNGRGKKLKPLYSPTFWSAYENVLQGLPRTTNLIEAWHSRWSGLVGGRHVGVYKLMDEIRLEQKYTKGKILAIQAGQGESKRKDAHLKEDQLLTIVKNYKNYGMKDYLTSIAMNLANK